MLKTRWVLVSLLACWASGCVSPPPPRYGQGTTLPPIYDRTLSNPYRSASPIGLGGDLLQAPALATIRYQLDVIPKAPWKYIVLHHSASPGGNADIFDKEHIKKGWEGIGYHLVIGNGDGSRDGEIEVTFRWTRQMHGAHAGGDAVYNQQGIGICLVGNFEQVPPTSAQLDSLVSLLRFLLASCNLDVSAIKLHKEVRSGSTECPGRLFPFTRVLGALQNS